MGIRCRRVSRRPRKGYKALAVAQGEEICGNYRKNTGMDVVTLRLDHVYGVPRRGKEEKDPCFRMCLEALKTGRISASDRHIFSMLYLSDAVELACRVMLREGPLQDCYHISSMDAGRGNTCREGGAGWLT